MILVAAQDLFERWQKMDASVLTEEEVAQGAITKARWMALRDSRSSTQTQAAAPPLPPAAPPPLSIASGHRLWHRRRRLRLVHTRPRLGHTRPYPATPAPPPASAGRASALTPWRRRTGTRPPLTASSSE